MIKVAYDDVSREKLFQLSIKFLKGKSPSVVIYISFFKLTSIHKCKSKIADFTRGAGAW